MSAHNAQVFTAFLLIGGTQAKGFDPDRWQGQIGFAHECAIHARAIAAALSKAYSRKGGRADEWNYPGVLEYELIEPLGEWIATAEGYIEPRATAARFLREFRKWVRG